MRKKIGGWGEGGGPPIVTVNDCGVSRVGMGGSITQDERDGFNVINRSCLSLSLTLTLTHMLTHMHTHIHTHIHISEIGVKRQMWDQGWGVGASCSIRIKRIPFAVVGYH